MVLATDLKMHFSIIGDIEAVLDSNLTTAKEVIASRRKVQGKERPKDIRGEHGKKEGEGHLTMEVKEKERDERDGRENDGRKKASADNDDDTRGNDIVIQGDDVSIEMENDEQQEVTTKKPTTTIVSQSSSMFGDDDMLLMLKTAVKVSDLGHSFKRLDAHKDWSIKITEEFYQQGDNERALFGPTKISPFMDGHMEDKIGSIYQSQIGFFNFVVLPFSKVGFPYASLSFSLSLSIYISCGGTHLFPFLLFFQTHLNPPFTSGSCKIPRIGSRFPSLGSHQRGILESMSCGPPE